MNNENFHPVLEIPPLAHALHKWDGQTKTLSYEYNGTDIISMHIPESEDAGFRHGSDGTMQSIAYIQQIYISVEKPMWVTIKFNLSDDAVNMRPHRANAHEGIIGQSGNILLHGVNGLYDVNQDLLIEVNGCGWNWKERKFQMDKGRRIAYMNVLLSEKPLFINLKMFYYKNHLGYKYHEPWKRKPNQKPVSGWCSWEAYRRDISQEKVDLIADFMEEKLKQYGLEYIQVDDGYQEMPLPHNPKGTMDEGWFSCVPEKFPEGHEGIVRSIKEKGFSPAIWTNANITNEDFIKYHQDALIFHDGKPLKGEWIDFLYNCTPQTLEKHVTPIFKGYEEYGYEYVKIDAIRHLLFDGLHEAVRLGIMSNEEAEQKFRAYMEATKEGLSDDVYYLASWGEMHEVIGLVDACRISMDANPTWAGIRMQLFETARWFHSQRILFLNDPDHVCVRTKLEWAKSILSLISLSGELYMLSDTPDAYTDEKVKVIQKTLPPLNTRTAETGPLNVDFPAYTWTKLHGFAVQSHETPVEMEDVSLKDAYDMAGIYPTMEEDHPFSSLWGFHIEHAGDTWCVMGRFATVPLKESRVRLSQIQLDETKQYHAFDFWKEEYLGIIQADMLCKALNLGECQIIGLREVKPIPQFIASSRHVSMDAVSVEEIVWQNNELIMSIKGVENTKENYYFAIPEEFTLKDIRMFNGKYAIEQIGDILHVQITFNDSRVALKLVF